MATTLHAKIVLDALDMALWRRRPTGVIHHSDQGSQYISLAFGKRCRDAGVRPSTGSVGDAYDNAMAESFFATQSERLPFAINAHLCELLDRRRFKTHAEARMAVFACQSKASTIRAADIPRSAISRQRRSKKEPSIPARTILPPCSRPSRNGLETPSQAAPPACRPSLTGAPLSGQRSVQAGMER